jgi:myo-inositol catabolism protein IolS
LISNEALAAPFNWMRLGLGTWQLGGASNFGGRVNGWGELDATAAEAILQQALAIGVRRFDTADAYGQGLSEQRIGAVIGNRADCQVISKFGQREAAGNSYVDFSSDWLVAAVEGSLSRLRRERLDLLLLHSPPDDFDFKNYDRTALENLQKQGKLGRFGVSVRSRHGAQSAIDARFGSAIELLYNALDRRAEPVIAKAAISGISIIARGVMGSGWLNRKDQTFSVTDQRNNMAVEAKVWFAEQDKALNFLNDLPGGKPVSLIRFVLANLSVACALVGVSKASQLTALNQACALGALEANECEQIRHAVPDVFHAWQ